MVQNISNKSTLYKKTSGVHPKLYFKDKFIINKSKSFPRLLSGKETACQAEDASLIPG